MLQTQVNYWNYVETKRHNYATEEANLMQAQAALSQAESAARNADTNAYNAMINRMNAETNVRNAEINAYNAQTQREGTISNIALNTEKMATERTTQTKNLAESGLTGQKTETEKFNTDVTKTESRNRDDLLKSQIGFNRAKRVEADSSAFVNLVKALTGIDTLLKGWGL